MPFFSLPGVRWKYTTTPLDKKLLDNKAAPQSLAPILYQEHLTRKLQDLKTLHGTTPRPWVNSYPKTSKCGFLSLPPELRFIIYELALCTLDPIEVRSALTFRKGGVDNSAPILFSSGARVQRISQRLSPALLRVCRQVHAEAVDFLYAKNSFEVFPGKTIATPLVMNNTVSPSKLSKNDPVQAANTLVKDLNMRWSDFQCIRRLTLHQELPTWSSGMERPFTYVDTQYVSEALISTLQSFRLLARSRRDLKIHVVCHVRRAKRHEKMLSRPIAVPEEEWIEQQAAGLILPCVVYGEGIPSNFTWEVRVGRKNCPRARNQPRCDHCLSELVWDPTLLMKIWRRAAELCSQRRQSRFAERQPKTAKRLLRF